MIKTIINRIPKDKKDHVLLGMIVGYPLQFVGIILDILFIDIFFIIASVAAILIVAAKEIVHDWLMKKGNPEWWDFIASAIPILATMCIYFI